MTKLILAAGVMLLIITLILISSKYLRNRYKGKPYIKTIFITIVLFAILMLYMGITGKGFTPLQASGANKSVEWNAKFLKEIKVGDSYLHIYYNPSEKLYRTTYTEDVGIFYRSNSSTSYYPHEEDMIRTLGGNTVHAKEGDVSVLYIENKDTKVNEIATIDSEGNYISRQSVKSGEAVVIQYDNPAGGNTSSYKILALNEDLDVAYYYGYELNDNQFSDEEYKWYPMKNEKLDIKFEAKIKSGNLVTNYNIDNALNDIDTLGLNTLNIPVVINIDSLSASDMSIDEYSKGQAIRLIKKLLDKNINVILEPYPWIDNGSKYETGWLPENIDAFFYNWRTKVLKPLMDDIAIPYHVEAFNIGTSFTKIENNEDKFCEMVDYVRNNYKGLITYRTSWWATVNWNNPSTKRIQDDLKLAYEKKLNNKLFSKVDFISIAAYFELTGNDRNTVDNLVDAIESTQRYNRKQNVKQEIKNLNIKWNKPIFFGELGFPPKEKASIEPWNPYLTDKMNAQEQANCFEAYRKVFEDEQWNLGFSIFAIGSKETDNNYYPSDYSVEIIKGWYSNRSK